MKLFLSPFKPFTYLTTLTVLILLIPLGRFYVGDGHDWTFLGGCTLTGLFALAGAQWAALNQLGASYGKWIKSSTLTASTTAVLLGLPTAASSIFNQLKNPYYQAYDLFLFTNEADIPWIDTNGDPYFVSHAAQDTQSIALTATIHVAFFFVASIAGVALGLACASFGAPRAVGMALITLLIAAALCWTITSTASFSHTATFIGVGVAGLITVTISAVTLINTKHFVA